MMKPTTINIKNLKPGWELDKWIGENILLYSIYHYDKGYTPYWMLMDEEFNPVNYLYPENQRKSELEAWQEDCPKFSTDIRAALDLVEMLGIAVVPRQGDGGIWGAWVCPLLAEKYAVADTAPLAICFAAIKNFQYANSSKA